MASLDDFQRKLRDLRRQAQPSGGAYVLPLTEVLPDHFIRQYTEFQSLQEMLDASGLDDPPDLDSDAWSQFVATRTYFSSWETMLKQAMAEWTRRQFPHETGA
jgi:hypothetical protein